MKSACPRAEPATTGLRQSRVLPPAHSFPSPSPGRTRSASMLLVAVLLVGTLGLFDLRPAWGGDGAEEVAFPERFMVRGGAQFLFAIDLKYRFDGPFTAFGTTIDFDDDLDGDNTDEMFRADGLFRINPRHSIGFAWYDINLSGVNVIDQSFQIDDTTFAASATLDSKAELILYRLFYNYSFYHSQRTELFGSFGMYVGDLEFVVTGTGTITRGGETPFVGTRRIKEDLFAPLPSIGFGTNYLILPKLAMHVRADVFWVKIGELEGAMSELFIGLEYRLFKRFALGAAFDRVTINVEHKAGKSGGFDIDGAWNGGLVYGALYF